MDMNSFVNAIQTFNSMGPAAQNAFLGAFNQSQPNSSIPSTPPAPAQTQHSSFTLSSQPAVQGRPHPVFPIPRPLSNSNLNLSQNQVQQPSQTQQLPPAVAPYQSSRLQGLPAPNSGNAGASLEALASGVPGFAGMTSVGVSLAQQDSPTSNVPVNVNEARLQSALNSLPQHNPSGNSQQRGQAPNRRANTRPRTNAIRPPRPPPERPVQPPGVNDCFFTDLSNQQKIRIAIHVHPEAVKRPRSDMEPWEKTDQIVYHRNLAYKEQAFAEHMGLHHEYEVLAETDVRTILLMVKQDMEQHPHRFIFQARDPQSCISANRWTRESEVPFVCMEFCNGGKITPTLPVRMRAAALSNLISIEQVTRFSNIAVKPFCISKKNQFVFHIRLKRAVKATFSLADVGLGRDRRVRQHTCMSIRYNNNNRFRYDSSDVSDRVEDEDSDCEDQGDEAEVEDVIMEEYLPALRTSNLPIIPIPGLWSGTYTPPIPDIRISVRNFTQDIFCAANLRNNAIQELNVSASSSEGLAEKLLDLIIEAVDKKDFSHLLSPQRFLRVIHEPATVPASSGFGVEMEALTLLFGKYHQGSRRSAFFKTLHEDQASICFSTSMRTAGSVSSQRLLHLEVLGAIIGLMLAHCRYPKPLGPFILQYLIHDMNILSLDEHFTREWSPDLHRAIKFIIDAGEDRSLAQVDYIFQSYCETSAAAMDTRSAEFHERLPCEVLYASTIGREPPAHPELQAFYAGMQTPCSNGFKMTDAIKAYPGGSSAYLGLVSSSHITSYNDIRDIITLQLSNDADWATITSTLDVADALGSFGDLFREFLQGSGVPVPALWGDARNHISDFVNLDDINEGFFRPRMFAWAATGAPELKRELVCGRDTIDIFLSSKDSAEYKDPSIDDPGRHAFAQLGMFCIHTCSNMLSIPLEHLLQLGQTIITAEGLAQSEPAVKANALKPHIFHWLLIQTLNAIGKLSLL